MDKEKDTTALIRQQCLETLRAVRLGAPLVPVPRGEVWLGSECLAEAGLKDTLKGHLKLAEQLDQVLICLPVATRDTDKPSLGYRYFLPADVKEAVRYGSRFVMAAVDGPFQELVNKRGLADVLINWIKSRPNLIEAYKVEEAASLALIRKSLDAGADAIVITDDLAGEQGPMISPKDIDTLCSGFYENAASEIHNARKMILLHCCGHIHPLSRLIEKWRVDGLAAIQHGTNDLVHLQSTLPGCVLMAGMDAGLLEADPTDRAIERFKSTMKSLMENGGIILSSSCGIYHRHFLKRVKRLYRIMQDL